jgi:uncharacterized protein (DUF2342 family)
VSLNSDFTVQADALARQATSYAAVARQVANLHNQAVSDAQAHYGDWGADEAGTFFAQKFLPNQNGALEQLNRAVSALEGMAQTVYQWAQTYPATDNRNLG